MLFSINIAGNPKIHSWDKGNLLNFETRSCWGPPQTLSLKVSSVACNWKSHQPPSHPNESGGLQDASEVGYCWVDLRPAWRHLIEKKSSTLTYHIQVMSLNSIEPFDENGGMPKRPLQSPEKVSHVSVTFNFFDLNIF